MNKLLNAKEIAIILNVSKPYAYTLMRRGDIPTIHLGKAVRVRPEDLEEFISKQASTSSSIYSIEEKPVAKEGI